MNNSYGFKNGGNYFTIGFVGQGKNTTAITTTAFTLLYFVFILMNLKSQWTMLINSFNCHKTIKS